MSRTIPLTQGRFSIVDDSDYKLLNQWKWQYGGDGYAVRDEYLGKVGDKYKHRTVLMHRIILEAPIDLQVDHINRDKLDNRRCNLRLATQSQNKANMVRMKKKNTELPMGVTYNPSQRTKQPYMARVCHMGRSYFLGNFYTVDEASKVYKQKKKELFGEFANA